MLLKSIISFLITILITSPLIAAPLDANGDGLSDPLAVIMGSSEYRWVSIVEDDLYQVAESFGREADIIAPGNYSDDGLMPAIINSNGVWNFADGTDIEFGNDSSLFISGADFDGNGIHDLAYSTNACTDSNSRFNIMLNPLQDQTTHSVRIRGKGNYYKVIFDINNDGSDDICSVNPIFNRKRQRFNGRFNIICKNYLNERVGSFKIGRNFTQPRQIFVNGEPKLLLTRVRTKRNTTNIKLRNTEGRIELNRNLEVSGDIVIGNYTLTESQQIAIVSDNIATVYDPANDSSASIDFPNGTNVSDRNIETFNESDNCFCTTSQIKTNGSCSGSSGGDSDGGDDSNPGGGGTDYYVPNNCSNSPKNISQHDGFKCMGSSTRGGSIVCLLPYQFTWSPHKMKTDHHNYTFACNRDDESFDTVNLILNNGSTISLNYAGCHNYVATQDGPIGRQHFRNESVKWSSVDNSVVRIEMIKNGSKTCLSF